MSTKKHLERSNMDSNQASEQEKFSTEEIPFKVQISGSWDFGSPKLHEV
jgi:hypothetical protein